MKTNNTAQSRIKFTKLVFKSFVKLGYVSNMEHCSIFDMKYKYGVSPRNVFILLY